MSKAQQKTSSMRKDETEQTTTEVVNEGVLEEKNNILNNQKTAQMKTFYFNIQAKGGVGKSFLTYLLALKEKDNEKALFIDLDSSVRTSAKNINFLKNRKPARLVEADLLDDKKKTMRDKLLYNIESFCNFGDYEKYYLDFGAPESTQLPILLSLDYSIDDLKEFEKHLGVKFIFNIIIGGDGAYNACTNFLEEMVGIINGKFETNIFANKLTFPTFPNLLDEIKAYADMKKDQITSYNTFATFDQTSKFGKELMEWFNTGEDEISKISFLSKVLLQKELAAI